MSFSEALEAYNRRHNADWVARLTEQGYTLHDFTVEHEPYWFNNDTGTGWPASTTIVCKKTKIGAKGQKHTSKQEFGTRHNDPIEFMQALFEEDS